MELGQASAADHVTTGGRTLAHRGHPCSSLNPSEPTSRPSVLTACRRAEGSTSEKRNFAARNTANAVVPGDAPPESEMALATLPVDERPADVEPVLVLAHRKLERPSRG